MKTMNQSKSIYTAGLDLGSAATRCVIARLDGARLHFAGAGAVPSNGWTRSRVVERQAVSSAALKAVQMAEAEAGVQLESVVVGCGGLTVRGANTRSRTETGRPREIEQRDVNRAFERAARVQLQDDRMILQLCPQEFALDDRPGFRDPRKMVASSLEVNAHLITISTMEHNTIVDSVNHAHLSVDETYLRSRGGLLRVGAAGRAARRAGAGGHRRAIDAAHCLLRRRHATGRNHSGGGRSFHARYRAFPARQLRRCGAGERAVRKRGVQRYRR